jgi:predicted nucleic acid-binding protein
MGQLNLPPSSLIYLDTVAIIYSIERFPEYITLLEPMWQKLRSGDISIVTSELAVLETLVMPIRQSNTDLITRYERLLFSSEVSLIPITQAILKSAATLRAQNNIKTPDSIHAATATDSRCDFFITNDVGFRKISGLRPIVLKDLLLA